MPFDFASALNTSPLISSTSRSRLQQDRNAAGLPDWFTPLAPVKRDPAQGRNKLAGRTIPAANVPLTDADEALALSLEGHPSVNLFADGGKNATVTVTRQSQFFEFFDERDRLDIEALADEMLSAFRHFSSGPYKLRTLARMGHPYGFGPGKTKGGRSAARRVPRRYGGQSIGGVIGQRGSVPTMSIINAQSGKLRASWHKEVAWENGAFTLRFWNTAKTARGDSYPLFLMYGTGRMQGHGPFNHVPARYMRRLDYLHRRSIHRARRRYLAAQALADQRAREEAQRESINRATGMSLGEWPQVGLFGTPKRDGDS